MSRIARFAAGLAGSSRVFFFVVGVAAFVLSFVLSSLSYRQAHGTAELKQVQARVAALEAEVERLRTVATQNARDVDTLGTRRLADRDECEGRVGDHEARIAGLDRRLSAVTAAIARHEDRNRDATGTATAASAAPDRAGWLGRAVAVLAAARPDVADSPRDVVARRLAWVLPAATEATEADAGERLDRVARAAGATRQEACDAAAAAPAELAQAMARALGFAVPDHPLTDDDGRWLTRQRDPAAFAWLRDRARALRAGRPAPAYPETGD